MRLLLDTCAAIDGVDGLLPTRVKQAVSDAAGLGDVYVSIATAWEVAVLAGATRRAPYVFKPGPEEWYGRLVRQPGFREEPIRRQHCFIAGRLPPFHRDPVDRVLIATAHALGATLVTCDTTMPRYAAAGWVTLLTY